MQTNSLVLASGSKYRKALLEKLNLRFICAQPNIDENTKGQELPTELAVRLAEEKARALATSYPNHFIIGSDQVAMVDKTQLHKPGHKQAAIEQLRLCSGKQVKFYTSVCVLDTTNNQLRSALDICTVYFKNLTTQQINHYINIEQPYHCAGSFKSEGLGIALFERIAGDDPNALVGLPLIKLIQLLQAFDIEILS